MREGERHREKEKERDIERATQVLAPRTGIPCLVVCFLMLCEGICCLGNEAANSQHSVQMFIPAATTLRFWVQLLH